MENIVIKIKKKFLRCDLSDLGEINISDEFLSEINYFDKNGRVLEEIRWNFNGSIDFKSKFEYDENGNLTKWIEYNGESIFRTHIYFYNNNKKIEEQLYNSKNFLFNTEYFYYDDFNNCIETKGYDDKGMLNKNELYVYEKKDKLFKSFHFIFSSGYGFAYTENKYYFNKDNEKIIQIFHNEDGTIDTTRNYNKDFKNNTVDIKMIRNNGDIISREFSKFGKNNEILEEIEYNGTNYDKSIYYYNSNLNLIRKEIYCNYLDSKTITNYYYDIERRLINIICCDENNMLINSQFNYYDKNGNICESTIFSHDSNEKRYRYEFDENNQLVKVITNDISGSPYICERYEIEYF
jgi:hypothetical protein